MKRLFIFVFAFSLMLLSAAAAETDAAASGYIPARENLYGLYQDSGAHSSQTTVTIPVGSYEFGQPVSIEDDLKGQDIALLFICNRITYRVPITDTYMMPLPLSRTNVGV